MADTKISALTAVTTPASTDQFAVNQSSASKRMTLSQIRGGQVFYYASDYGTIGTGAAIQAAMDACFAAGGGVVVLGAGTWTLGTTSLTFGGDGIMLQGAGKNATFLTYTGTGAAVKNAAATNPEKRYCGIRDLSIDVSGATTGSTLVALHIYNFYRGTFENLQIKCGTVATCDGIRLEADSTIGTSTYYNLFRNVDISTSGFCVQFSGNYSINRNRFEGGLWEGAGKALVHSTTASTCDTNVFQNLTITSAHASQVMKLGGSGGAWIYNHFENIMFETGTSADITMATGTGQASNNYFFGGIYGSVTITTQDNMDNHIWVPSQEGLNWMKIAGNGTAAQSVWFERDNGGMTFGSGQDVTLYRGGNNLLRTGDSLTVDVDLTVTGNTISPNFTGGSATAGSWPTLAAGTLLTTPEDGAIEMDTTNLYGTVDAGNRGIITINHFIRANATRTFTSNTSSQAIFTTPTNGRITLETGIYRVQGLLAFTGMSATSGNLLVNLLGAGTATISQWLWMGTGADIASGTVTAGGASWSVGTSSPASIVTAATNTAMAVNIDGTFSITGAGTMIPAITMVTASASVLSIGSYLMFYRLGATGITNVGQWD